MSTKTHHPRKDLATLRKEAENAAGPRLARAQLTPALPTRWPEAGGGIVFFAYRNEPLPTGRVLYRVSGPLLAVRFSDLAAAPVVEEYAEGVLGEEEKRREAWPADFKARLERAEETLLDVVAGNRTAESARAELQPYSMWLAESGLIARDLEGRAFSIFGWLRLVP